MGVVYNLSPNPACGTDATGWSSNPAGYARSTSVDAGLPRATGFEGSIAADVLPPRAQVTAGQQYVWSISVKAIAALSSNMLVNYYTAPSGGTFVGNSGSTVPLNLSAGSVGRFILGPYTVPAGAVSGYLKLNDLDGACEVTGYRVAPYSGDTAKDGAYFDGASTGWSWDGTANNSTSTARVIEEAFVLTDSFSKSATAAGPVGTDPFQFAESFSIAASGAASDNFGFVDGFLIAELSFDDARGRVRVQAFTFGPTITSVRVSSRTATSKFTQVRGGTVAVIGGLMARPVDDYEYAAGADTTYLIEGLTDLGQVVQSATVVRSGAGDRPWLKFIANPALNRPLSLLTDYAGFERESRTGLFDVQGRPDPIVVSDAHSSRRQTIRVATHTPAETAALDFALSQGIPCYLQSLPDCPIPSMYASVGSYSAAPATRRSQRSIFTIPLTEVAAPATTVAGAFHTWQTVLDTYPTWADVLAQVGTWRDLAA